MGKGNKKKRMKKYKKKYYTGGRIDMSKGGRVSLQEGGNPKYGDIRVTEDGVREQFSPVGWNATKEQPKPVVKKPIEQEPQKPIQVGEPVRDTNLKEVGEPVRDTNLSGPRRGADEPIDVIGAGGGPDFNPSEKRQELSSFLSEQVQTSSQEDEPIIVDEITEDNDDKNEEEKEPVKGKQTTYDTTASPERTARIGETASQVQESAKGTVPQAAVIPGVSEEAGTAVKEEIPQAVTTMQDVPGYVPTEAKAEEAQPVTPETVTTGEVKEAQTPQQIEAAKMEAEQVTPEVTVDAAEGAIDEDKALAKAAGVDRVEPIDAAEVDIPEGALADRVIGTLSEDAKAEIAQNAGTSLRRITRAKKQLSKAGLSDTEIAEIGNDPEALEDRLEDFSEEQRGIIEGLPEEALVSTQINGLLTGIEDGKIPLWAKPAVASVEAMLAQRGMSASTVGRDALLNTIIQAAMPIAQSNAQAIQSSVAQQRDIEFRESEANTQRKQQVALDKANKVFNMNMAQFNADQQTELSNSKFLQTVGLTEASNEQQAVIQDALLMSQANLAEADFYQKTQIQNAQSFLSMDMANLSNKQQSNILKAQQQQQRVLSNQAAQNAAAQFNATSENQTEQFMTSLTAQMNQYNASQMNAMEQFNSTQKNASEARRTAREADVEKFNAQLLTQVDQFNSQQDFARNQWNAQNSAAVEASNVQWRRQANTVNTAAQNQINMQNAMNAFGLSTQSLSFLWQELRDQADFDFRSFENEENRQAQILATAIANEGKPGEKYDDYLTNLLNSIGMSYKQGLLSG